MEKHLAELNPKHYAPVPEPDDVVGGNMKSVIRLPAEPDGRKDGLAAAAIVLAMKRAQRFALAERRRGAPVGPFSTKPKEPPRTVKGREIYTEKEIGNIPIRRVFVYFDELAAADGTCDADEIKANSEEIAWRIEEIQAVRFDWCGYNILGGAWAENDKFAFAISGFETEKEFALFGLYAAALLGQRGMELAGPGDYE